MRKFIVNIFKFIIAVVPVYIILLIAWGITFPQFLKPNLNYVDDEQNYMRNRLNEVKQKNNINTVVFGSSAAYRGFDPRIFKKHNIELFNLGSSMQSPIQMQTLIKKHIDQLNPKLIIFEVYPYTFCIDGVESGLDIISNANIDKPVIDMVFKLNNIKTYNTLIFAIFKNLFIKNNLVINNNSTDKYVIGGYVEHELSYVKPWESINRSWNFNQKQIDAFEEVLELIKSKNINYVLVYAPVTKQFYNEFDNHTAFNNYMNSIGNYYNFNNNSQLTDTLHFYDSHHLNQTGVELFNEKLISVLKEEKFFN